MTRASISDSSWADKLVECSRCARAVPFLELVKDKDWCKACGVRLRAAVLVRRNGSFGSGHVGWAWEFHPICNLDEELMHTVGRAYFSHVRRWQQARSQEAWFAGAIENPGGLPLQRAPRNGSWSLLLPTLEIIGQMRAYDAYKIIEVEQADPRGALSMQHQVTRTHYAYLTHNCMNSTYRILTAFGAQLPDPQHFSNWRPNAWFDHIAAEPILLKAK